MNRRKLLVYMVLLAVAAVLITACGPSGSETPGAGTESPGLGTSEGLEETEVLTATRVTTSTETIEPTEAISSTETISPTEVMTSTEALPPTGAVDPHRASVLMEFEVWNQNDEVIGVASDLVLDFDESKLTYVAVAPSSGDGTEVTLVPLDALEVTTGGDSADGPQNAFVLTVDAAVFEGAPTIDPADIPGLGDDAMTDWDAEIHSYWADALGMDESMEATPTESMEETPEATPVATDDAAIDGQALSGVSLASEFIGAAVETGDMQAIGTVDDVILDYESGDLQYAVVRTEGDALVPVPLAVLTWNADNQALGLLVEQSVLEDAPAFDNAEYPDTEEAGWDQAYQDYWAEYLMEGEGG